MQQSEQKNLAVVIVVLVTLSTSSAVDECFSLTRSGSCWTRRCRKDQFISSIDSDYQRDSGDRVWKVCCRDLQLPAPHLKSAVTCNRWTDNQNSYWGSFSFKCPGNTYMSGIHSCYSDHPVQDRQFRFRCCQSPSVVLRDCENWGVNGMFQARSMFTVENGRILIGMNSVFDSRFRDRVYENTDCAMIRR